MDNREEMLEREIDANSKRRDEIVKLLDSNKISDRDIANIGLSILAVCGVLGINIVLSNTTFALIVDILTIPSIAFIVCNYTNIFKKSKKSEKIKLINELDYLIQEIKDNTNELEIIKANKRAFEDTDDLTYYEIPSITDNEVSNVNNFSRKRVLNNNKNNNI